MKILLVSPYSVKKVGGIGTWSKSVLDYVGKDADVEMRFQNTKSFIKKYAPKRETNFSRIVFSSLDTVSIIVKLFFNLLFFCPEVVHLTSSASYALHKDRVAVFITKRIFHKHFVIHWHFGRIPQISKDKNWEYKLLMKVLRDVDASIVIDQASFDSLKREGVANIYYVPNPVTEVITSVTSSLDIDDIYNRRMEGTVLYVGHLYKNKGIFELVEACVNISDVKHLIMVGFGNPQMEPELKRIAARRDNGNWLTLTGDMKREDVFEYYKRCSVFCLPSYTEGFPYVVLEAMSYGCPVVATNVGAIPEMLADGCGVVISPKSVEQTQSAIEELLHNRIHALDLGMNAHNRVYSKYTIDIIYGQYKTVWEQVKQ